MIIDFSGGKKGEKCCRLSNSIWNLNARFALVYFDFFSSLFSFSFIRKNAFSSWKKKSIKCVRRRELYFHFHSLTLHFPEEEKFTQKAFEFGKEMKIREPSRFPPSVFPMPQQSYPFERLKFLSRWGDAAESRGRGSNSSKIWNESVSLTEWDLNVFRAWKSE